MSAVKDEVLSAYLHLRSIKPNQISGEIVNQLRKVMIRSGDFTGSDPAIAFRLCIKVAIASSYEEFEEFVTAGVLPTVKLTSQEMEMLKGGAPSVKRIGGGIVRIFPILITDPIIGPVIAIA